jgi:transposase
MQQADSEERKEAAVKRDSVSDLKAKLLPSPEPVAEPEITVTKYDTGEVVTVEVPAQVPDDYEDVAKFIALLAEERAGVEAALHQALMALPGSPGRTRQLQSIPGIGPAISATLMSDLPELGSLDRKAIASLAGLAPHPNQSGTLSGKAHIGGGRPCVRAALYMAAVSAVRSDKGFKREYQALRAAGKPAKVALIAIARKIVVAANSMLRDGREWTNTP